MNNHEYKDSSVYVKSNGKFRISAYIRKWKCPICSNNIEDEEEVSMVLNNFKYFPNTLVHTDCIGENLEQTFTEIESKYRKYKEIVDETEDMF